MPHIEIINYKGQKVEVVVLDTEVHPNQPANKVLKEIRLLLAEDRQYQKDGRVRR